MRLITRADLDGLTCAVLLSQVEKIDDVMLAHPKDVQDGKVDITSDDILANLPHDKRAGMIFDHHASQSEEWKEGATKGGFAAAAPSAARVVAGHYPNADFSAYTELLLQTDRLDSADLEPEDVTDPKGWILVGYTLDPRTGWAMGNAGIVRELLRYARLSEGGAAGYAVPWPDHPVTSDARGAASPTG